MTTARISGASREALYRMPTSLRARISLLARETLRSAAAPYDGMLANVTEQGDGFIATSLDTRTNTLAVTESADTFSGSMSLTLGMTMDVTEPNDVFVQGGGSGVLSTQADGEFIYVEPEIKVFWLPWDESLPFVIVNDPNMAADFEDRTFRVPAEDRTIVVPPVESGVWF